MLFNPPRNSPRLLLLVAVLATLSLCFFYQWQRSSTSELWTEPRLETTKMEEVRLREMKHQKARFQAYVSRLNQIPPSYDTLDLPEGFQLIRIEDINEESERIDHLTLSELDFDLSAEAHSKAVALLPEYRDVVQYNKGSRGIVTVGGGPYQPALIVSIRMLRKTNCTLPIEVFVPEESDYDPYSCDVVLRDLNAKCVVLPHFENTTISRYQYKSVALLFTSFEDTLFLDADNFPIVDPTPWFASEPYLSTGLITWPDFWASTASPVYFRLTNQSAPSLLEHASSEAGSIVISRRKHASTLLLAFYYNLFGPDFYYLLLSQNGIGGEGDKETWVYAAKALNTSYYQVRERNHAMMWADNDEADLDNVMAMLQYDPVEDWRLQQFEQPTYRNRGNASIVFLHCNRVKMNPPDILSRLDEYHPDEPQVSRMWGNKQKTIDLFGRDMEAELWGEILEVACRYGKVLTEIDDNDKGQVCEDLRRYWWRILLEEELEDKIRLAGSLDSALVEQNQPVALHEDAKKSRSS